MTDWPTVVTLTELDADSDNPILARPQIKSIGDAVNNIIGTGARAATRASVTSATIDGTAGWLVTGGYTTAGDGGGALYKRVGSEPSHAFKVQSGDGAWWEGVPEGGVINVNAFGAVGDGVADDTTALQNAINYAEIPVSLDVPTIVLGKGQYRITSPLTATTSGNHFRLMSPHMRQASIVADAVMTQMLTIGQVTGVFSRIRIDGIRFDCNFKADTALDLTYVRYSLIENNEFAGMTAGNPAAIMGRWVNRFRHNTIDGIDSGGTTASGHGLHIPDDTLNDFQITENSFTSCQVGVKGPAQIPNDCKIERNTFDSCSQAAIYFRDGCRNLIIRANYFEKCGTADASGVPIDAVAGGTANYSAPIIVARASGSSTTSPQNVVIRDNHFVDCDDAASLGLFSGLKGLTWEDNHVHDGFSYTNCVRMVEFAVGTQTGTNRKILIDQQDYGDQFTELVDLAATEGGPERAHAGLQIIWRDGDARKAFMPIRELVPSDLTQWTLGAGTSVTQSGFYEKKWPIYVFNGNAVIDWDVTAIEAVSTLAGRYIRIGFLQKGDGAANGARFILMEDTGAGLVTVLDESQTDSAWDAGAFHITHRISPNATRVLFRLDQVLATPDTWVTLFTVDSAAAPLGWT